MWHVRRARGKLRVQLEYDPRLSFFLTLKIPRLKVSEAISFEGKVLELPEGSYEVILRGLLGDPSYRGEYGSAFQTAYGSFERRKEITVAAGQETVCLFELPRKTVPVIIQVCSESGPLFGAEVLIRDADPNFRVTRPPDGVRFDMEPGTYPVVIAHGQVLLKEVLHVEDREAHFRLDISKQTVVGASRVVVRYLDGRTVKGMTDDFVPGEARFTVLQPDGERAAVDVLRGLKAVFFVKSLEGNAAYDEQKDFGIARQFGQKTVVRFRDGEALCGYTLPGHPAQECFFLFPVDPKSNNAKVYVIQEATVGVET